MVKKSFLSSIPPISSKKGCMNPLYIFLIAAIFFITFRYFAFLPGRHYEDGHFLALVNDEDVRVLHALGYGLDENKKQLYSKEGLPMFAQGSGSQGYVSFDATEILLQLKKDAENNKSTPSPTPMMNTLVTPKPQIVQTTTLPTETPSEAPSEDMDETEGSFSSPGQLGEL